MIDTATTPTIPVSPRTKFTVAIALLFALLLNCAIALARDFFADRLPSVDEWEERFGRPVLATVPPLQLKAASAVLLPKPEGSDRATMVLASESLSGPTRWSAPAPEVAGHGQ